MSRNHVDKAVNNLLDSASTAAASGDTPEDAYKRFMAVVGKGIMQVVANGLDAAVNTALTATHANTSITGWEKYVKGCVMNIDFGAPINTDTLLTGAGTAIDFEKVLTNTLAVSNISANPPVTPTFGGSISVSVGGNYSF